MKLEQVERIIKNEILNIKSNKYNYSYDLNVILYAALDKVDYNKNKINKDLLIRVTHIYFKNKDLKTKEKQDQIVDDLPF